MQVYEEKWEEMIEGHHQQLLPDYQETFKAPQNAYTNFYLDYETSILMSDPQLALLPGGQ